MKTTSLCLAVVVAILLTGSATVAQPQRKVDATTILTRMFLVYSGLTSYEDEGILITTVDEPSGGTIKKMPFKTFFKGPNLIRFEWTYYGVTKLGQTKVIWFNGKDAFTYWEPDKYEKAESLSSAVAGATGITSNVVNTVLTMVMPKELWPSSLNSLSNVSLLGEELFEGVPCYRIKATEDKEPIELWIGKSDFLLRKLREESKYSDGLWINEEIRRKIQIDRPISEAVFDYKPRIPLTPRKEVDTEALDKLLNPGPPVWTEFKSDEGRFSILMPEKPQTQASSMDTAQGRFEQHAFIASHDKLVCMVAYTDLPKQALVDKNVDGFFDGVRDQFIKEVGGQLGSETPVSLGEHSGREIKVLMFRGDLRLRVFLVADRLYILSFLNMEKVDEEATKKFFASFKLTTISRPIAALRRSY